MREQKKAEEMLELVEARLDEYRLNLASGKEVDLKGFEERVHLLCEMVTALPKEQSQQFEARMKHLSVSLNDISAALTKQYEAVKQELKGLEAKQKARDAYARTTNMPGLPPKPSDDQK